MQRIRWISVLFVIGFLFACTPERAPVLRLGTNVWPGYEPFYLARDLGYLPENSIKLVEYSSSTQVIQAYRNGAIDAAALTLDEVLMLSSHDQEPRVILVLDSSFGADAVVATSAIKSMAQLKGKRVGVESTALGAYMIHRALEVSGMNHSDITLVPMPVDEHETAFKENRVDAVVTFEPVVGKLLARGGNKVFDSKQIPDEVMDVLVVRKGYLEKYPQVLQVLAENWFKALAYHKLNAADAEEKMAQREGISAAEFKLALGGLRIASRDDNLWMLSGHSSPIENQMHRLETVMIQNRLLSAVTNLGGVVEPRIVQQGK